MTECQGLAGLWKARFSRFIWEKRRQRDLFIVSLVRERVLEEDCWALKLIVVLFPRGFWTSWRRKNSNTRCPLFSFCFFSFFFNRFSYDDFQLFKRWRNRTLFYFSRTDCSCFFFRTTVTFGPSPSGIWPCVRPRPQGAQNVHSCLFASQSARRQWELNFASIGMARG